MPRKKKETAPEFSYCIGRPWHPEDPNSAISCYAYGTDVFYGNMEHAKKMRTFIELQSDDKKKYSIYMLVKVPE